MIGVVSITIDLDFSSVHQIAYRFSEIYNLNIDLLALNGKFGIYQQ